MREDEVYTLFHLEKSRLQLPTGGYLGFYGTPDARAVIPQKDLPPLHLLWKLAEVDKVTGHRRLVIVKGDVASLPEEFLRERIAGKIAQMTPPPAPVAPPPLPPAPESKPEASAASAEVEEVVEERPPQEPEVGQTFTPSVVDTNPAPAPAVDASGAHTHAPANELEDLMGSLQTDEGKGTEGEPAKGQQPEEKKGPRGKRR